MRRPRTLRGRLLLWVSTPMLTLWIISTLIDYDVAKGFVNLNYDRALLDTALDLGRNMKEIDGKLYLDIPQPIVDLLIAGEQGRLYYKIETVAGDYVTGDPGLPRPPQNTITERVAYYDETFQDLPIRGVAVRTPIRPGSGLGALRIFVAEQTRQRDDAAKQIMLRMALPQLVLVALALVVIWLGVGLGLRTLTLVRREIQNRSPVDLSPINTHTVPLEIRPLVDAMNDLLNRLGTALAAQQRFIADAAHQLRTPIAALKSQIEVAQRNQGQPEGAATLETLHHAADHATRLVTQLLTMARAEPGSARQLVRELIDLPALVSEVTREWVPAAITRQIDLGMDAAEDSAPALTVQGDPFLLREMLGNLIDNALRYTPAHGRVTVRTHAEQNRICLEVEDSGRGIPPDERDRIFERFYRIPDESADGCGLGLAIVKEIANGHHARITVSEGTAGHGTRMTVSFPAP